MEKPSGIRVLEPQFSLVGLIAFLLIAGALHGAPLHDPPPPSASECLTAFSADLPQGDAAATVSLRFEKIRPLGPDKAGDVIVQLQRRDGKWSESGHSAAADYNQKSDNKVELTNLGWTGAGLDGTLRVTIGPDSPRPGVKGGFPPVPDVFDITVKARRGPGEFLPWNETPSAFMPPWRRDEPAYGGLLLTGTFTATRGAETVAGTVTGSLSPAPVPGFFGAQGNIHFKKAGQGGLEATARLAPRRVAPPAGAEAVKLFAPPLDWGKWDGLRLTVSSPGRRDDASLSLGIKAGGAWYHVRGAARLSGREETVVVPFDDFRPALDQVAAVEGIAVGVDNPHGVGDVAFTVRRIELVQWAGGFAAGGAPAPAKVLVDPDTAVSLNGAGEIPKGLFGDHDVNGSAMKKAREDQPDPLAYMRQINPGLLRTLAHTGFGGKPLANGEIQEKIAARLANKAAPDNIFFQRAAAANALDNVITTHTADLWMRPGWMDSGLEKTADGVRTFYRNLAADAWAPGDENNFLRKFEVWNEPFMWGRHTNRGSLNPPGKKAWEDSTQYGYIPGKLGADAWSDIFLAAVDGAKSANPHVLLGGPSAPDFGGDDYGVLENYVGRILDRTHEKLDFLTEHHYGGNPRSYAASYEVITAWCDAKYGRRIPIYNTEANDLGASSAGKAAYNIMDILACIQTCPDKVLGRSLHALWNGYLRDEGEEHAYTLLAPLRGKILGTTSDDPDVVAVAASPGGGDLVVFVFNNSRGERLVTLPVPAGFVLREAKILLADAPAGEARLRDTEGQTLPNPPQGKTFLRDLKTDPVAGALSVPLPRRSAVRWTLHRDNDSPAKIRDARQYFTDAVLARVSPSAPVQSKILWHGVPPAPAAKSTLRVVTADVQLGEAVAVIGGREIPLPWSSANDGHAIVQEIPLDPSLVTPDATITFRCASPDAGNGFTIYAASVILTGDKPPATARP